MKRTTLIASLLLVSHLTYSQETVPASGGDAEGSGGASSYTVGQIVYTTNTGDNGSIAQGIQQAYEILVVMGIDITTIQLEMTVYPNPTTNCLQLKVDSELLDGLTFQLIDLQGKVIENKGLFAIQTTVNMEALPAAIYFLHVRNNNQVIKTFKIIKQ